MAVYIVSARLGSAGIHPALGTAIVTGIAFLVNVAITLAFRIAGAPIAFSMKSASYLLVVGVATACINLFTLLAYASGLRVTSSFVILEEPFTWRKLFAVALIAAGTVLLQRADA